MSNKNDITGDTIKTRVPSTAYNEGWDRIFKKPLAEPRAKEECVNCQKCSPCKKKVE